MAVDITKLRSYTDGAVYSHAIGATITAPTNATTALDVDFTEVGALADGGITESTSQDRKDVYIWQNNTLARRIPGKFTKTWKFAATELSLFNLGLHFAGSTVTSTTEGASVQEKAPTTDIRAWVLQGKDGASRQQRIYIPLGEITDRGDVVWNAEEVTVYEWTLSGYVDTSNIVAYRYYIDAGMAS